MLETPLAVQRLRLHAPTAGGAGLILVREVRSLNLCDAVKKRERDNLGQYFFFHRNELFFRHTEVASGYEY